MASQSNLPGPMPTLDPAAAARRAAHAIIPAARADGWTAEKQRNFLEHLAACGSVSAAARAVGMSREGAYALRRRAEGRAFAQAWDAARLLAAEHLVEVAWDRALNGVVRPIWYHGEQVGEVLHHDSRLLLGLIAQNRQLAEGVLNRAGAGAGVATGAAPGRGGSPLASGAVVAEVLADWDAALERVERGEALIEPVGVEAVLSEAAEESGLLRQAQDERGFKGQVEDGDGEGYGDIPPPLPPQAERGVVLDEAQVLAVGSYGHWWDEAEGVWLTNWPAPDDWDGTEYRIDGPEEAAVPLAQWLADYGLEEGEEEAEHAPASGWARTMTEAELAGLAALEEAEEDHRAARLELYRRAAFGLATPAERAALAAANRGRADWHRAATPRTPQKSADWTL